MRLLSRLFPSSQVRDCKATLRLLRADFEQALFYGVIERAVLNLIEQNPAAVQKKLLVEGQSAHATVLHCISNIAFQECASGQNHVYRGVLSIEGNSHRQVFDIAGRKLLEIGAIDQIGLNEMQADLAATIKEAG